MINQFGFLDAFNCHIILTNQAKFFRYLLFINYIIKIGIMLIPMMMIPFQFLMQIYIDF
jgi:hypothetical protein